MKKEQKIIALRTAAKLKVAGIETKIAVARSEAASERARLLWERAGELEGLESGSTERYDVQAEYRAKLAGVEEKLAARVAQLKAEITQIKAECWSQCAESEDDPEPDTETDNDTTVKGFQPQQDTVYCDGSEHSARIVARRLINKLPHIPNGGSLNVNIIHGYDGKYFVSVSELGCDEADYVSAHFFESDGEKKEAEFVEKARRMFKSDKDGGNSHVAGPMSRALGAVFGGNPVEQVDNLIAETVKDRKEGGNE